MKSMHKKIAAAIGALTAGIIAGTSEALPVPGYIYPSSMQAGTTARITVGGMFMKSVNGALVTGGGVKVTRVLQVPGFPRATGKTEVAWAEKWLYDVLAGDRSNRAIPPEANIAETDWARCDWWEHMNERDELELQLICRFWHTPPSYPQPTPALDQLVILDLEVDANAKPGLRELLVYDHNSISAPHPFFITKEPHVVEPSFVIPMDEQRQLSRPAILHLPCKLPTKRPPVAFDGQAWAGEVDEFKVELKKGVRFTFDMIARELTPYLGDAVPGFFNPVMELFDPDGRQVAQEDDFSYLPDPVISCVAPKDGVYTLKVHDNLYRGRQDFVYTVRCYEDSPYGHSFTPQQRAFVCYPPPTSHIPPTPSDNVDVRSGTIDFPGKYIRHDFKVSEPMTMGFELFSRRMGSPLDGVIRLYGPVNAATPLSSTPMLAEWDDADKFLAGTIPQAICDPVGSWTFLDPGDYCVTISDKCGDGGENFTYTLAIAKNAPTFDIYAKNSSFLLNGNSASIKVKVVRRNGFSGSVSINDNDDFECSYSIPEDEDEATIEVSAKKNDWSGLKTTQLFASATVGDKTITRRITPADPTEQAFAYTHYLPQRSFFFLKP